MARQLLTTLTDLLGMDQWSWPPRQQGVGMVGSGSGPRHASISHGMSGFHSTAALTQSADDSQTSLPIFSTNIRRGGSVVRAWDRLKHFCDENYEELRDTLNWPATQEQLAMLQHGIRQTLPQAVCEWLLCCDGQEVESLATCKDGLFFGLPFLGTDDILREWQFWRHVDKDAETGDNPQLRRHMRSCPPGRVRQEYSHPGWIPLVADGMGNYLGVDLSPDPRGDGKPGQVILFGRDFDTKMVLYGCDGPEGWANFLSLFVDELEKGTSFVLGDSNQEDSMEDDIGYESYFTGSGERAGEGTIRFRLAGKYARWPVLESWFDRSAQAWQVAGFSLPAHNEAHQNLADDIPDISTSSSTHDPLDPLQKTPNRSRKSSANNSPALPRDMSWPDGIGSGYMNSSSPVKRRVLPKPSPLTDLPTIEDVRAIQATELVQHAHNPTTFNGLRGKSKRNSAYINMSVPSTTVTIGENVEMSMRPTTGQSTAEEDVVPSSTIDMSGDVSQWKRSNALKSTSKLLDAS